MKKSKTIDASAISVKSQSVLPIIKGSLIAVAVSLVGVLLFAFVIKFVAVPDGVIKPVNQIIKGLSILIGCFVGLKKSTSMGFVKGLFIGVLYTILSFIVFSILDGNFSFSKTFFNDLLFAGIIGVICGIMAVNFRKK